MDLVADLHLHSRFSRAVSQRMDIPNMYHWAKKKGINLLTVSDFTHPIWFKELKTQLKEVSSGVYTIQNKNNDEDSFIGPFFLLSVEISNIYTQNGKVHKIHNLVFAPNLETAEKINKMLASRGFNLTADGRPILGITAKNLYELLLSIDPRIIIIPCHVWTPWFSLYGSRSGFNTITECFGDYTRYIYAVETGLSSDPNMNWRIPELDTRSIVSFSDAHSLENMGREATIFKFKAQNSIRQLTDKTKEEFIFSYDDIVDAFKQNADGKLEIAYTIEFYPEEGKYHYTGHRLCNVSFSPEDVKKKGVICPVCRRPLTVGVMDRVEELAKKSDSMIQEKDEFGVTWVRDSKNFRKPYVSLVSLLHILKEVYNVSGYSNAVMSSYEDLIGKFGNEINVLLKTQIKEIEQSFDSRIAVAINNVRARNLTIEPGFDGEYGKVSIPIDTEKSEKKEENKERKKEQLGLF